VYGEGVYAGGVAAARGGTYVLAGWPGVVGLSDRGTYVAVGWTGAVGASGRGAYVLVGEWAGGVGVAWGVV
jgi:hypothetical protein